jgi:hypothetical protein
MERTMRRQHPLSARALLACALLNACTVLRAYTPEAVTSGEADVRGRSAFVETAEGARNLEVHRVQDGTLEGMDMQTGQEIGVRLRDVSAVRVEEPDRAANAQVIFWSALSGAALTFGLLYLGFSATR